jgi:predicted DsbA family dithiol-disulfide isomerase
LWHDYLMNEPLVIDIWSDVVCPFCYLGARQLEVALDRFEHRDDVVLRQRAFELDPRAPVDYSLSLPELLAKKYSMPVERARALNERLENDASALGMSWSMKDARPTNTFDAHRVIALSATQDLDRPMSERLFRAYFSEGQLVSDRDVLTALAKEVGVVGVDELWSDDAFSPEVRNDEADARELGISGVPSMLLDGKFMVVGAQGADQILAVLQRAWVHRATA